MSDKATIDLLDSLHGLLAQSMKDDLQRYINNGEPIPPPLLNAVIKFLKDNGIESQVTPENPVGKLAMVLPFPSDAELMAQ